jgi:hypothetical protein
MNGKGNFTLKNNVWEKGILRKECESSVPSITHGDGNGFAPNSRDM